MTSWSRSSSKPAIAIAIAIAIANANANNNGLTGEFAKGATGLLVVDMISCWDFPDADKLLPVAVEVTPRIASLKRRCRASGVHVIYANDNRGRWRSDFGALIELSIACGGSGAEISTALLPDHDDYFVLKPQQSAFVATPLEQLLSELRVKRLIVTGVASDQCVLSTATDARMRGLEVVMPRDCTGTQTARRHEMLLEQCPRCLALPRRFLRAFGCPEHHERKYAP